MAEYIERETAKRALRRSEVIPKYTVDGHAVTNKIIDAIPAADVAPVVHGRWTLLHAGDWTSVCTCSVCGRRETVVSSDRYNPESRMTEIYPYCHCGARMDGGVSNEP